MMTTQARPVDNSLQQAMQQSLFGEGAVTCPRLTAEFLDLDSGSSTLFQPGWLLGSENLFEQLRTNAPWRVLERVMYDRVLPVPRLICNLQTQDLDHSDPLSMITSALENEFQVPFGSIGLNYYRDGNDSVAWHRDTIGRTTRPSLVALVALGSPRTLAMRPYRPTTPSAPKTAETTQSTAGTRVRWRLGHGDLLVMNGACQREWEHCVPKERAVGPRISLAFRSHEPARGSTKS